MRHREIWFLLGGVRIAVYVAFFDESGTPEIKPQSIDKNFPVFTLAACVFEREYYLNTVNPIVDRVKYSFFQHRGVILHSSDIRKRKEEFVILNNKETNTSFINKMNDLMVTLDYQVIASSIHKQKHVDKYGDPKHPYDLTFEFVYEKIYFLLKNIPGGPHECHFIFESRNKNQDAEILEVYNKLRENGNRFFSPDEFKMYVKSIRFFPKKYNETGNQIADLVAYPISRYVLDDRGDYEPFNIVYQKIYKGIDGERLNQGLKTFPYS